MSNRLRPVHGMAGLYNVRNPKAFMARPSTEHPMGHMAHHPMGHMAHMEHMERRSPHMYGSKCRRSLVAGHMLLRNTKGRFCKKSMSKKRKSARKSHKKSMSKKRKSARKSHKKSMSKKRKSHKKSMRK